jgi:hypothetical protein
MRAGMNFAGKFGAAGLAALAMLVVTMPSAASAQTTFNVVSGGKVR